MKTLFLIFFFVLTLSSLFAQDYTYLPESNSAVYEVKYQQQGAFCDSLFIQLRKAGFRELAGIGEFSKQRTIPFKNKQIPYGVVVTYSLTQIIVRFITVLPKRNVNEAIESIWKDYNSVVKI